MPGRLLLAKPTHSNYGKGTEFYGLPIKSCLPAVSVGFGASFTMAKVKKIKFNQADASEMEHRPDLLLRRIS